MRLTSTLLICTLLSTFCLAQKGKPTPAIDWGDYELGENLSFLRGVGSIQVDTYEPAKGHRPQRTSAVSYHCDESGQISQVVELGSSNQDTLFQHKFSYHKGQAYRKLTQDHRYGRSYWEGYRFTTHQKVYQEKSYELLPNDDRLLLNSRQYIYDDGANRLLKSIRTLENNQVVEVARFDYDQSLRVVGETTEDSRGIVTRSVLYRYDQHDRVAETLVEEIGSTPARYVYAYNEQGKPMEIKWFEGEQLKGLALYEYDEAGRLTNLSKTVDPQTARPRSVYKVFSYEIAQPVDLEGEASIASMD